MGLRVRNKSAHLQLMLFAPDKISANHNHLNRSAGHEPVFIGSTNLVHPPHEQHLPRRLLLDQKQKRMIRPELRNLIVR